MDSGKDNAESIQNQEELLKQYIDEHPEFDLKSVFVDNGEMGVDFIRPAWNNLMRECREGRIKCIIIKDMSRLGRDHLRVGLLLEQFRERGVRFIAINDGVDTERKDDDFTPFRNIINEWVARDTSRKIRAINDARTKDGKHVTGAVPYGYLRDPNEKSKWILDEAAAPIVRRMFESIIQGKTVTQIADELTAEGILIPTAHWHKVGAGMRSCPNAHPTKWSAATVITILRKQEYMGWCVLNKTVKEIYKSKCKQAAPEDMLIFKDAHPAIVDGDVSETPTRIVSIISI